MSGKLVEFPRKLVWEPVEGWRARVPGTPYMAQVERVGEDRYQWATFIGAYDIGSGEERTAELAQEAAKKYLEKNAIVLHPHPTKGTQ